METKTNSNSFWNYLLAFALGAGVGYLLLPNLFNLGGPSDNTCVAPSTVNELVRSANSVKINWNRVAGIDYYLVTVRDSSSLTAPEAVYAVKDTVFAIPNLKPVHGYRVDVQSVCERLDAGSSVSSAPIVKGVRTKDIVIEVVVHFGSQLDPCTKNSCGTGMQLNNNCFSWLTTQGPQYYQVEIKPANTTGNPVVLAFFEKTVNATGATKINSVPAMTCGVKTLALNPPTDIDCEATVLPAHLCGSFKDAAGNLVRYRLEYTQGGCCVKFNDPAQANNYTVSVKSCTDSPI